MSCGPAVGATRPMPQGRLGIAADEGFRLFFPLAAVYAALFPLAWVLAFGLDLPLSRTVPPSLWHAHEMLIGAFGAALIGFLTTAAPEWTDSEPLRGRPLWVLAGLWGAGRVVGFLGWDGLSALGALADLGWMAMLLGYLLRLSIRRRTDRLLSFAFWLALLAACTAIARLAFLTGDLDRAARHVIGVKRHDDALAAAKGRDAARQHALARECPPLLWHPAPGAGAATGGGDDAGEDGFRHIPQASHAAAGRCDGRCRARHAHRTAPWWCRVPWQSPRARGSPPPVPSRRGRR